jgi:Domain of unknown function (DUF4214)
MVLPPFRDTPRDDECHPIHQRKLLHSFFRRGGDAAGVQYWIGQIASGANTREVERTRIMVSPEFQGRVARIIGQGCLP